MLKEMVKDLKTVEKNSTPEEYEEYCHDILKEAGLGGTALNVAFYGPDAVNAVKKGSRTFKQKMNKPIMIPAVGETPEGMKPLNEPPLLKQAAVDMSAINGINSMEFANLGKPQEKKKDEVGMIKYLPHIVGAAALGLGVAEAIKKKSIMEAIKTFAKGSKRGGFDALDKNIFIRTARKAAKRAVESWEQRAKERVGFAKNQADIDSAAAADVIMKNLHEKMKKELEIAKRQFRLDMLNKVANDPNAFGRDPKAMAQAEAEFEKVFEEEFVKKNPILSRSVIDRYKRVEREEEKYRQQEKEKQQTILNKTFGGIAQGVAMGSGALLVQSLGDEYFRKKDMEELRQSLRKSRSDAPYDKSREENYTPNQLANRIIIEDEARNQIRKHASVATDALKEMRAVEPEIQRAFRTKKFVIRHKVKLPNTPEEIHAAAAREHSLKQLSDITNHPVESRKKFQETGKIEGPPEHFKDVPGADESPLASKEKKTAARKVWENQDFQDNVIVPMKRGLIVATVPAAAGLLVNRDLKSDLKPVRGKKKKPNSGQIIVDIPMGKMAADAMSAASKLKVGLKQDAWRSANALAWVLPPTVLTAVTGRNIRGNFEKTKNKKKDKQLDPVKPGMARIIIETSKEPVANDYNSTAQQMR